MRENAASPGQVAVELVAIVPLLILIVLALVQLAIAGYGAWSAGNAARAGSRAALVGGDVERAALSAVPGWLERRARVEGGARTASAGRTPVRVTLDVPSPLPGLPAIPVRASAALAPVVGGG